MKIKLGHIVYTGSKEQFEKLIAGIDTEPETRSLPEHKREQLKAEIRRQIDKQSEQ